MQKLSTRSIRLRILLKDRMKQSQITYAILAKGIGVSLPTIKRWMTKDDFPVEALDRILRELGLSWQDILTGLDDNEIRRRAPSSANEAFIASHPRESFVFLLIFVGFKPNQIQKELKLSEKELKTILLKLDKNNLIAYRDNGSIVPLIKPPFRWTKDGKFSKKYFLSAARKMFNELIETNPGFASAFNPSLPLVHLGEMYMSDKSLVRLKADLWEFIEKYREIARHEMTFKAPEELSPVAFLLAVDKFPLWKKIMWDAF